MREDRRIPRWKEGRQMRSIGRVCKFVFGAGLMLGLNCALAADDFSIEGTYTQDQPCVGDGTDPDFLLVKITDKDISYASGVCSIDSRTHTDNKFGFKVTCKFLSGSVMGSDIAFTVRDPKTLDMKQQDGTYEATLYKCPAK
jgi:hypothetical protein